MFECVNDPRDNENEVVSSDSVQWSQVVSDCNARLKTYKKMGYEIEVVDSINELKIE